MGLLKNIANSAWTHAKKGAGTIWKGAKVVGGGLKKGGSMLIDAYKGLDDDTKNSIASYVGGGIQALGTLPTPMAPLLSAVGIGAKHLLKGSSKSSSKSKSSDGSSKSKSDDNPWSKEVKGVVNPKTGRKRYVETETPHRYFVSNYG